MKNSTIAKLTLPKRMKIRPPIRRGDQIFHYIRTEQNMITQVKYCFSI